MNIKVLLFGSLVDIVGKSSLTISDCVDTNTMKEKLLVEYPKLKNCVFLMSLNKKLVANNQKLESGNEVALLPPFAGG